MKRVNVVKTDEVQDIGVELQFRMRVKKLDIEKVIEWGLLDEVIKNK